MNEILEKIKEQLKNIFGGMSQAQRIITIVAIASIVMFGIIFSVLSTRVNYSPLLTDLNDKDAAAVKTFLDKKGVKYKITHNGTAIEVEDKEKYNIRLDLAQSGAMPKNGVGFEIFDTMKIGATEYDKKIMFLRAQSGELERTISAFKQVKSARVEITPSNDAVFAEEKTPAKASVMIEMQPLEKLSEENILAIMRLVASAVDGLSYENVEVMDTDGNLLSDRVEAEGSSSGFNNKKLDLQKKIEKELEQKARGVLDFLGSGNAKVKVAVELDFDKEVINSESYTTPTVNNEQLPQGIIRSKQENSENYKGAGSQAEGVPGTTSNIPGYVGTTGSGAGKEYNKSSSIVNYEMDSKKQSFEKSLGKIRKITVSVVLNKDSKYFKDIKFTTEERAEFESIVKTAVNFDDRRGDTINVSAKPFNMDVVNRYQENIKKQEQTRNALIIGIIILIIIAVGAVIALRVLKNIEEKKMREREKEAMKDLGLDFDQISVGEQFSVEEQERMEKEEEIREIVKSRPEDVANLIKTWMIED